MSILLQEAVLRKTCDVFAACRHMKKSRSTFLIDHVLSAQNKDVMSAVSKLHGCDVTPANAQKGGRGGTEAAPADGQQRLWARQVAGEGAHHKKWRIIIRNLSFQVISLVLHQPDIQLLWTTFCLQRVTDCTRGHMRVRKRTLLILAETAMYLHML